MIIATRLGVIAPFRSLARGMRVISDVDLTIVGAHSRRDGVSGPDLVWLARPAGVLLQRHETHHAWTLAPSFVFQLPRPAAPAAAAAAVPAPAPRSFATPSRETSAPASVAAVDRPEAALLTRRTVSTLETLLERRERVSSLDPAPASRAAPPPPARERPEAAVAHRPPPPAPPPMIFSVPPRATPPADEPRPDHAPQRRAPRDARPGDVPEPRDTSRLPAASARLPDHQVDRIADQVVRALDHRVIAWRERMGRR
jgi:hypothetical protein